MKLREWFFSVPALLGVFFGLVIALMFVLGADGVQPEWGDYWWIRPALIIPVAGCCGGAMLQWLVLTSRSSPTYRVVFVIFGVFVLIISLWLGTVLGLDGTYWD